MSVSLQMGRSSPDQPFVYCSLGCENTAYGLIDDWETKERIPVCAECISVLADMNSDNHEWLWNAVAQAIPLTGQPWNCTQCHQPSDSFHCFNGICTSCRGLLYWPERATCIASALALAPEYGGMTETERRFVALDIARRAVVVSSVCLVCQQSTCRHPVLYVTSPEWLAKFGTCSTCGYHIWTDGWCCVQCGSTFVGEQR